jgi:hypothetical protein
MSEGRIPAHLEVSGIIRIVQAAGGFATVLSKGERDAGTLLIICCENGTKLRAYERMPSLDGGRKWVLTKTQDDENPQEFNEYCAKRGRQDDDLWVLECDVRDAENVLGIEPESD